MSRRRSLQFGIALRQEDPPPKGQSLPAKKALTGLGKYLSTMEHGKVEIGVEILLRISREFGKSIEWLLAG
jgi:hypothetical protein